MRVNKLKFWCQKVLPLVYDDSLSYYEVLCKLANKINEIIDTGVGIGIADPIQWNITNQYPQNTIVVDSNGTAYISKQPVPVGVEIDNENYWLPVFNYGVDMDTLRSQICYNAKERDTTEVALNDGDLVFWKGLLYKVIVGMNAGTAFIVDDNIEKVTVNEVINDIVDEINNNYTELNNKIDNLEDETEADFNNIEAQIAINEEDATNATQNISENQLVFLNHKLYIATRDIPVGTTYIVGTNINPITVDEKFSSTIISTLDYVTPQMYGAVGDGTTEDSNAIQQALDSGKPVVFPNGTYVCRNVYRTDDTIIIGLNNAVLKPFYINGIAQNIITINNANKFYMENITIKGEFYGTVDMSIMRNSAVELNNLNSAIIYNCLFDSIDDSYVQWEAKFRDRKALAITAHDVSYVRIENCHFNNLGADESAWITNRNLKSIQDITVDIIGCSASNMTRLSLFDIIAGQINIDRMVIEENCNFQTFSIMNLFGDNVTVLNSEFYGNYGDAIDTYEGGAYFPDMVYVNNCVFKGYTGRAITCAARNINIINCEDEGRSLLVSDNSIATLPDVIGGMDGDAYTTYVPTELIRIENCIHNSSVPDETFNAYHAFLARIGGAVIYRGNYCDQNGLKGNAIWLMDVTDAKIENNVMKNCGYTTGASSIRSFIEISSGTKRITFEGNECDANSLGALLATGAEYIRICGNTIISGTSPIVTNGGNANYKVNTLVSDSTRITLNANNYSTAKGDYIEGAWVASSSSATSTELTDRITLPPGMYLVSTQLPFSSGDLLAELYNYTINGSYGYQMIRNYGVMTTIVSVYQTCQIGLRSASSSNVTFTNYQGLTIRAIPLKIG